MRKYLRSGLGVLNLGAALAIINALTMGSEAQPVHTPKSSMGTFGRTPSTPLSKAPLAEKRVGYLTLETEEGLLAASNAVVVDLHLRNIGKEAISYGVSARPHFAFAVRDEKGKNVPLTAYGRQVQQRLAGALAGSNTLATIPSGSEVQERFVVSQMFDMSVPGTYTLTASWNLMTGGLTIPGFSLGLPTSASGTPAPASTPSLPNSRTYFTATSPPLKVKIGLVDSRVSEPQATPSQR